MQSLLLFETQGRTTPRRWLTRVKPQRVAQRAVLGLVHRHPVRNVLLLGQPKSGSTWLRRMLCEVPGFVRWSAPSTEWWNDHPLAQRWFDSPPLGYTVTRVHSAPTPEHLALVGSLGRPAVVLFRDLRDVCVSWAYFVETSTFPMPERLRAMPVADRLDVFIEELLPRYHRWAEGWAGGPGNLVRVRYEDLVVDTAGVMRGVLDRLGLAVSEAALGRLVARHSFAARTGRTPGEQDAGCFDRKGVVGDWRAHFTRAQGERFAAVIAEFGPSSLYDYGAADSLEAQAAPMACELSVTDL